ncbi:MAG: MFS transporter [Candidatus Heimdallarchaeaceae archaeon]
MRSIFDRSFSWFIYRILLVEEHHSRYDFHHYSLIPGGVVSILLAPKLGKLADKLNPVYTLGAASILGAVMTWLLINSTQIWQFSIIFLVDSTVVATGGLVLTKIVSAISKERRGTVFGLHDTISNLGNIGGPLIGGALWDVRDRAPFILSIIIEGCLAVVYPIAMLILRKHIDIRGNNSNNKLNLEKSKIVSD